MGASSREGRLSAPAKLNLALHVGPVQADGYHPVDTLCVFADLGDEVRIVGASEAFALTATGPFGASVPTDDRNLVLVAAHAAARAFGAAPVQFELTKHTPAASGIGGGTSNGAAALVLLWERAGQPIPPQSLIDLSGALGADGPVITAHLVGRGSCLRARGIGEMVTAGPRLPRPLHALVANPLVATPTGRIFRQFDCGPQPTPFSLDLPPQWTKPTDMAQALFRTRNDLAAPARSYVPAVTRLESAILALPGCLFARMSGSGASVFGLFVNAAAGDRAARVLQALGYWARGASVR